MDTKEKEQKIQKKDKRTIEEKKNEQEKAVKKGSEKQFKRAKRAKKLHRIHYWIILSYHFFIIKSHSQAQQHISSTTTLYSDLYNDIFYNDSTLLWITRIIWPCTISSPKGATHVICMTTNLNGVYATKQHDTYLIEGDCLSRIKMEAMDKKCCILVM